MYPAARLTDPITHDLVAPCGVIGPAAPAPCAACAATPVVIEFLPAAHVNCSVICTGAISGGIVHPPSPPAPIVTGSLTVQTHFLPAARWTPAPDIGACGVFLGNVALAATRKTLIGG